MTDNALPRGQRWLLLALTCFTFFFLLGSRSLNEPDEGRYAEVAQEMLETGDWVVPQLWYAPHLTKPPLAYWAVAASMAAFGQSEWAVRLPLALAGISGVCAVYLFGCALGGRRVGFWAALILQSCFLYFVMARVLTTDIFLAQSVAWASLCLWHAWRTTDATDGGATANWRGTGVPPANANATQTRAPGTLPVILDRMPKPRPRAALLWQLGVGTALAFGFLAKGPMALVLPAVAVTAVVVYRRKEKRHIRRFLAVSLLGLAVFCVVAVPWFWVVWQRVPGAFDFMVFGQAVGHALGTTIKNRQGHPLYYVAILGVGLMPWTILLGWLWRRAPWRSLTARQKECWLMLWTLVIFTVGFFSFSRAKLPAYVLPAFPPLAIMLAGRFFAATSGLEASHPPRWAWHACLAGPQIELVSMLVAAPLAFNLATPLWFKCVVVVLALSLWPLLAAARRLTPASCAAVAAVLSVASLECAALFVPAVETELKSNQTLKPLGTALRSRYEPGNVVVCWGRFPQGLPFYARPAISITNRPYLGGMNAAELPFEYPGNRERFGNLVLEDEAALIHLLSRPERALVVASRGTMKTLLSSPVGGSLRLIVSVGRYELFTNR